MATSSAAHEFAVFALTRLPLSTFATAVCDVMRKELPPGHRLGEPKILEFWRQNLDRSISVDGVRVAVVCALISYGVILDDALIERVVALAETEDIALHFVVCQFLLKVLDEHIVQAPTSLLGHSVNLRALAIISVVKHLMQWLEAVRQNERNAADLHRPDLRAALWERNEMQTAFLLANQGRASSQPMRTLSAEILAGCMLNGAMVFVSNIVEPEHRTLVSLQLLTIVAALNTRSVITPDPRGGRIVDLLKRLYPF